MANQRDDFSVQVKELLAKRVGMKCSNPNCRKLTCAANSNNEKYTNIGVASHICAAAKGGPRYDKDMTSEERKSFENGIWLCQSCSKLIDSDIDIYNKDLLLTWKNIAEQYAMAEVQSNVTPSDLNEDKQLIMFFVECFERPAFQDDIHQEGHMEDFDKAIEDTIIALNTGILRTRDGVILKKSCGKSAIKNPIWREKFNTISDMLSSMRRRLNLAKEDKMYSKYGNGFNVSYCFNDRELGEWFNATRFEIMKILSSVCVEVGLPKMHFKCRKYYW